MWSWDSFVIGIFVGGVIGIIALCLCFITLQSDNHDDKK